MLNLRRWQLPSQSINQLDKIARCLGDTEPNDDLRRGRMLHHALLCGLIHLQNMSGRERMSFIASTSERASSQDRGQITVITTRLCDKCLSNLADNAMYREDPTRFACEAIGHMSNSLHEPDGLESLIGRPTHHQTYAK